MDFNVNNFEIESAEGIIEKWIQGVPQGYLMNTHYGRHEITKDIPLYDLGDSGREFYLTLLALLVEGEKVSTNAAAGLLNLAPSSEIMLFLATHTLDEARHYEIFSRRLAELGVHQQDQERLISNLHIPSFWKLKDLATKKIESKRFIEGLIIFDIGMEGMSVPLLEFIKRIWGSVDPITNQMLTGTLMDERRHAEFGLAVVKALVQEAPQVQTTVNELVSDAVALANDILHEVINCFMDEKYKRAMADFEISPGNKIGELSTLEVVGLLYEEFIVGVHALLKQITTD